MNPEMKSSSDKKQAATEVGFRVLETVLRDEPWQDLGFGGRPRYGAFFQRFRAKWRVRLEKAALQEMIIILTTAYQTAGFITEGDVDEVMSVFVDGTRRAPELWRTLSYDSRDHAQTHLRNGIAAYAAVAAKEWPGLLLSRVGVGSLPKDKASARLIVGAVRFCETAHSMVAILRQQKRPSTAPLR